MLIKNLLQLNMIAVMKWMFLLFSFAMLTACTSYSLEENRASFVSLPHTSYVHENGSGDAQDTKLNIPKEGVALLPRHAPLLKVYDTVESHNKVGTPKANSKGKVWVDSESSTFYSHEESFQIEDRKYRNLIYRVHFSSIPFSIIPFHLTAGKNVGLIFIVTLNENDEPILFTTSHTCGCYKAFVTTNFTPESFYPENWPTQTQKVYGERLPVKVSLDANKPDLCVAIRPDEHRVMDVYACDKTQTAFINAEHKALGDLRKLPDGEGSIVSFFHEDGFMEGYVKGSVKGWESISLSFISLDFFVGTDKAYLRPESSNNTFYTSLKPWRRHDSDMANFPVFLKYWGWKL